MSSSEGLSVFRWLGLDTLVETISTFIKAIFVGESDCLCNACEPTPQDNDDIIEFLINRLGIEDWVPTFPDEVENAMDEANWI